MLMSTDGKSTNRNKRVYSLSICRRSLLVWSWCLTKRESTQSTGGLKWPIRSLLKYLKHDILISFENSEQFLISQSNIFFTWILSEAIKTKCTSPKLTSLREGLINTRQFWWAFCPFLKLRSSNIVTIWFNIPLASSCLLTSRSKWSTGLYACGSKWNIESLTKQSTINYTAFGWNNMAIFFNYLILADRFVLNLKR